MLAAVRDLREHRAPASPEELEQFEVDVLAGFVLARASSGVTDATIRGEVGHLEHVRTWFERALWEMEPSDADRYFGEVLHHSSSGTRQAKSLALRTFFEFMELRHQAETHAMTGRVLVCPIDEMNRPRGNKEAKLRIPPCRDELTLLFSGWAADLATCRKFAPRARNYTAGKLMADLGLRVNEVRHLDLADVKWELGRFGKLHVRYGKGSRGSGPKFARPPRALSPSWDPARRVPETIPVRPQLPPRRGARVPGKEPASLQLNAPLIEGWGPSEEVASCLD